MIVDWKTFPVICGGSGLLGMHSCPRHRPYKVFWNGKKFLVVINLIWCKLRNRIIFTHMYVYIQDLMLGSKYFLNFTWNFCRILLFLALCLSESCSQAGARSLLLPLFPSLSLFLFISNLPYLTSSLLFLVVMVNCVTHKYLYVLLHIREAMEKLFTIRRIIWINQY